MYKSEAEFKMNQYTHLLCKVFAHKTSNAQMKLTFLSVDKENDSDNYKVNCFADGAYGHIIEDLDVFLRSYEQVYSFV